MYQEIQGRKEGVRNQQKVTLSSSNCNFSEFETALYETRTKSIQPNFRKLQTLKQEETKDFQALVNKVKAFNLFQIEGLSRTFKMQRNIETC